MVDKGSVTTAYQDLTGYFPIKSTWGSEYVLIGYHYDANCILGQPIQDRRAPTITKAWQLLQDEFSGSGVAPESWVLDNEIPGDLKAAFKENNVNFQLVPPHLH